MNKKNTNLIKKNFLKEFLQKKKLAGVAAFLDYLKKDDGLKNFNLFCKDKGIILPDFGKNNRGVLFHGSEKLLVSLAPNQSVGNQGKESNSLVYATDNSNYAIFLATIRLHNGSAGVTVKKDQALLTVDMDFVNGPSKIKEGYVYVVPKISFKKVKNSEYVSTADVKGIFVLEVDPSDLTVPIYVSSNK